ncbi:hypothetical protein [Paracoccus jeotgali]|uniref:Uncharacterized protein n=1 Tax=Paracoccus jeotgali TaxID=2065379 RepID=A0A2K9MBA2_9RHOB|nr:hypothetical protein [Paracoccus jeotgali]AUM72927.1 hypothetical protein CYR75_00145 [Paracoccus jeotgali]
MSKHKLEQQVVDRVVSNHLERLKAITASTKSDRAHRMRVISQYNEMVEHPNRHFEFDWFMEQRKLRA